MVKQCALDYINCIITARGWGTAFRHSFRIGGPSFCLVQKVNPEIVDLAGRWRSLAYEIYIHVFKQIILQFYLTILIFTVALPHWLGWLCNLSLKSGQRLLGHVL
ncbi:hypothetical protein BDR04DRAFT_1103359 [Suillus decipiens]|nr:hypothetical protein BDR04DRAFT_1103359 [Suillus decipiens]